MQLASVTIQSLNSIKLCFHWAHFLSSKVPESCLLIILGVLFGAIIFALYEDECSVNQLCHDESQLVFPKLMPDLFFLYLLPPIILEASYCLHNRHFYDNLGAILLFAVAGTLMNFLLIGLSLCFIHKQSLLLSESRFLTKDLTATEIFLFSSCSSFYLFWGWC